MTSKMIIFIAAALVVGVPTMASAACVVKAGFTSCSTNVSPVARPVVIGPVTHRVPTKWEIDHSPKQQPLPYTSPVTLAPKEVPPNGIPSGGVKQSPQQQRDRATFCKKSGKCGEAG